MYGLSPKHHQQRTLTPIHLSFNCQLFWLVYYDSLDGEYKDRTFFHSAK